MAERIFSLLVMILAFSSACFADSNLIGYGAIGGVDFANASLSAGTTQQDLNARTGIAAGMFADIDLIPYLYFEPSMILDQKGADLDGGSSLHLDYVEFPLLLKFRLPLGRVNLFVGSGVTYGIAINKQLVDSSGNATDLSQDVNNNELSIPVDLGAEFIIDSSWSLMIEGRESWGMTNVLSSTVTNLVSSDYTSRNLSVMVGVVFRDTEKYNSTEKRAVEYLETHPDIPGEK